MKNGDTRSSRRPFGDWLSLSDRAAWSPGRRFAYAVVVCLLTASAVATVLSFGVFTLLLLATVAAWAGDASLALFDAEPILTPWLVATVWRSIEPGAPVVMGSLVATVVLVFVESRLAGAAERARRAAASKSKDGGCGGGCGAGGGSGCGGGGCGGCGG